jgi:hypothetical protein
MLHGIALVAGGETVGTVGIDGAGLPTLPVMGDTLVVGTAVRGLTPRLPISEEPMGIPARALPLGELADVDVGDEGVGVDDAATLLEPEPHIADNPDVSSIPEDVDTPDVGEFAVDVDTPDDIDVPDVVMVPGIAVLLGVVVAVAIPPPS